MEQSKKHKRSALKYVLDAYTNKWIHEKRYEKWIKQGKRQK